ncbi:MAG: hypothetical protein ACREFV_12265, partial [Acetobacteraceae bacterium]
MCKLPLLLLLTAVLASCAAPPPSAYEQGSSATGRAAGAVVLGKNTAGETCTSQQAGGTQSVAIYCGTWDQPSAEVSRGPAASGAELIRLATTGAWRSGIDARYACGAPETTTIAGGKPAVLLSCTRRLGGWPQVALVALAGGSA